MTPDVDIALRADWQMAKIKDRYESWGGLTPSKANASYWGAGIPWISSKDVNTPRLTASTYSVTQEAVDATRLRICPPGSVLVVVRSGILAHTLPVCITEIPVVINQDLKAFYSAEPLMNEWLALFLQASAQQLLRSSRRDGTTVQSIQYPLLKNTLLPVPPPPERERVIEVIQNILAKQQLISSQLKDSRRAANNIRQSLLAAAYRAAAGVGKEVRLEELLAEPMRNGYSANPVAQVTPFKVLTLTATTRGWFDKSHFKHTAEEFDRDSPFWVRNGDLLIQRGNTAEYVGMPALYEGPDCEYLYPDLMIRARIRADIEARFVWYMLLSPQLRVLVRGQATGSAGNMPKINQKILNAVAIPIPDKETRRRIVKQLDSSLKSAEAITEYIATASKQTARSSQAVLGKAFRGELVSSPGSAA